MSRFLLLIALAFSNNAAAKEDCSDGVFDTPDYSYTEEKLFYQGTCHYRNKDFAQASEKWRELVASDGDKKCCLEIKISASNNLGYLLFFGFGVVEEKREALKHWSYAVSQGHAESEYHLCHAYADSDQPTYNKAKALMHCDKARLVYQGIKKPDSDEIEMLEQIRTYIEGLE